MDEKLAQILEMLAECKETSMHLNGTVVALKKSLEDSMLQSEFWKTEVFNCYFLEIFFLDFYKKKDLINMMTFLGFS